MVWALLDMKEVKAVLELAKKFPGQTEGIL